MNLPEKKQRWVYHAEVLPQPAGAGVTRRVLAYTDGLMCVENTFEKGAVGALHHHPHTQITYVVSGAFEFTVDGETHTVRAGDTILKEDGGHAADYEKKMNELETDFAEAPSFEILASLRELNTQITNKYLENL